MTTPRAAGAILASITCLAAVAGCSSTDTSTTAAEVSTATSSASRYPLSGLQDYTSVRDLVADLSGGGLECAAPLTLDGNSRFAVQQGRCTINGTEMVFGIFSSDAQRAQGEAYVRELKTLGLDYGFIEGGNWLVNCSGAEPCTAVKAVIGGRVETS